ncbi:hypothetical protein ACFSTC_25280 [Nonomuraea ferruginea]
MNRVGLGLAAAWLVIAVALLWAVVPGLFTGYDPIAGVAGREAAAAGRTAPVRHRPGGP